LASGPRRRLARGHVVLCGLGRKGFQLARDFRDRGDRVVVVETGAGALVLGKDMPMTRRLLWAAGALLASALLAAGCASWNKPRVEPGPLRTMTLLSDREDTRFDLRPAGGGWQAAGTGRTVEVQAYADLPCEVRAEAPGFPSKTAALRQPMHEVRFVFLVPETDERPRQVVEARVRILAAASPERSPAWRWRSPAGKTAGTVAEASAQVVGWARFRTCLAQVAESLARQPALQGKRLAVLAIQEGPGAAGLGPRAHDMLLSELATSGKGIRVLEPRELAAVLQAHRLTESDLAADPRLLGKVPEIDAVAVGVILCRTE
jgi:hypothetical protein